MTKAQKVIKRRFGNRYPWADWFRLRRFKLVRGKHYRYPSYSMAQMVRNAALPSRFNKRVSIQVDPLDRFIVVRVRDRDDNPKEAKVKSSKEGKKYRTKEENKRATA